jgi:hypothetical protein
MTANPSARLVCIAAIAALIVSMCSAGYAQQASMAEEAQRLPASANAVMIVNVERMRTSGIAAKEGWFNTAAGKIQSGMNFIPEGVDLIMLAANMDYETFHPRWSAGLLTADKAPSAQVITQITNGTIDQILQTDVVETPSDRFAVPIDDHTVAVYRPAIRQEFVEWFSGLKKNEPSKMKEYLSEGLGYAENLGTELIVAFDLSNAVSASDIYHRASDSEILRQNAIEPRQFAELVGSIRGLTLGVTVRDSLYASVKIDFEKDISSLQPIIKQLLQEAMSRTGAYLPEFDEWEPEIKGNQILLRGDLSTSSFRKIISLLEGSEHGAATASSTDSANSQNPGMPSKTYFDSVNSLVDDMKPRVSVGQSYTKNSTWLRKFADQIDNLPLAGVDPDMLAYGNFVSQTLRASSLTLIDSREEASKNEQQLLASGARSGGGYGRYYYGYDDYYRGGDGSRLRRQSQMETKSNAIETIASAFNEVETYREKLRQSMTQKYEMPF